MNMSNEYLRRLEDVYLKQTGWLIFANAMHEVIILVMFLLQVVVVQLADGFQKNYPIQFWVMSGGSLFLIAMMMVLMTIVYMHYDKCSQERRIIREMMIIRGA